MIPVRLQHAEGVYHDIPFGEVETGRLPRLLGTLIGHGVYIDGSREIIDSRIDVDRNDRAVLTLVYGDEI